MKKNETWSIVMFIIIFILAVCEFIFLPDGVGLRLGGDGLKHYYRIKPLIIILPVAVGSLGAGLMHHGTIKRGLGFFILSMAIFIASFAYQL
jgi:hypothetical protein